MPRPTGTGTSEAEARADMKQYQHPRPPLVTAIIAVMHRQRQHSPQQSFFLLVSAIFPPPEHVGPEVGQPSEHVCRNFGML